MLDLRALALDTPQLAQNLRARRASRRAQRERAVARYQASASSAAIDRLRSIVDITQGAIAFPEEPFGVGIPILPAPSAYAIVATDGSTLDPDPHTNADYYAINVGTVRIVYGPNASAAIASVPQLFTDPADLWVGRGRKLRAKQARDVALERDRAELMALARAAAQLPTDQPRIALVDGSLLRWDLEQLDEDARSAFLTVARTSIAELTDAGVAIAGYIAASRSRELLTTVELAGCPHPNPPCKKCAIAGTDPLDLVDADLMEAVLADGTRSPRTRTVSPVLARLGVDVCSTWVHAHGQCVKLEVPRAVVDAGHVELLASVVVDQLAKGAGYPPVLQEAHEAAVFTTGDRTALQAWVSQQAGLPQESAKARSKRLKRI